MKMVPITTSNGSTASALDQPNWPCSGLLNTLHAYTAPSASWTRTAATTIHHRPRVGSRSMVESGVRELAVAISASLYLPSETGRRRSLLLVPLDAVIDTFRQTLPLRHHRVLRILGRRDAALEDAEPGQQRGRQQRQAGERGH